MSRFEELKERVKDATDLASLIEGYVELRPRGRSLVGLCPFHREKTPSFTVFPDSQYYKCFGCGVAGDAFTFLMEREGVSFREALEMLAERAHISLEGAFSRGERPRAAKDYCRALEKVAAFLHEELKAPGGERGRAHLARRGLLDGIDPFFLGYHPDRRGALRERARAAGVPDEVLRRAGLLKQDGYEPMRGRLMFPIHDDRGRIVGFGARALDDAPAKYLNSPDSEAFHKGRLLYGLWRVKRSAERRVVVVEGYTDVIACHLAGVTGAVAALGTAFTAEHAALLRRYARDGVVLLFDGDAAGRAAAARAFTEVVRCDLLARIALLDQGVDPADLLAPRPGGDPEDLARGRQRFLEVLDQAEDALSAWFALKRRERDLRLEANVAAVVEECMRMLETVTDPARRAVLRDRMAAHLGLDPAAMRAAAARARRRPGRTASVGDAEGPALPVAEQLSPAERADLELFACLLARPGLVGRVPDDEPLGTPGLGEVLRALRWGVAKGVEDRDTLLRTLFSACSDRPRVARLLGEAAQMASHIRDSERSLDVLLRMRRARAQRLAAQRTRRLLVEARRRGDQARVEELKRVYVEQIRETIDIPPTPHTPSSETA